MPPDGSGVNHCVNAGKARSERPPAYLIAETRSGDPLRIAPHNFAAAESTSAGRNAAHPVRWSAGGAVASMVRFASDVVDRLDDLDSVAAHQGIAHQKMQRGA